MRIGIDARPLATDALSGIGVYLIEILKRLDLNDGNDYILYSNEPLNESFEVLKQFKIRIIETNKIGTLFICYGLKKALTEDKIEVFWGTQHMVPLNVGEIRKVLTVHDLALLINPAWGQWRNSIMQNIFCRLSCKSADWIIADSEATKRDIVHFFPKKKSAISAIPLGGGLLKIQS